MSKLKIHIPKDPLADFCRRYHIRKLSVFGSALRDDFDKTSDVDVLVEFRPGARVGMISLAAMEFELSEIIGKSVDLNTPGFISPYFRDQVFSEAEVQYDAA